MTATDIAKPGALMAGKRGLVMGVANERSIAWGIARVLAGQGASLAFTYQGEAFGRRAIPLAKSVNSPIIVSCDVSDLASVDAAFDEVRKVWGKLDFVVHALAFSDRRELGGRYADTTRENFVTTMVISCFSFTEIAKRAAALMPDGGALLTLTYGGATRWVPSYNVMGVAKAALDASVRYLAWDLGQKNVRVNAVSAGPVRTLAARSIHGFPTMEAIVEERSPLHRPIDADDVGAAAAYLLSDDAHNVTGTTLYVDSGYHAMGM
jgi:enoyl-[acyl-carrier protein] reductase I